MSTKTKQRWRRLLSFDSLDQRLLCCAYVIDADTLVGTLVGDCQLDQPDPPLPHEYVAFDDEIKELGATVELPIPEVWRQRKPEAILASFVNERFHSINHPLPGRQQIAKDIERVCFTKFCGNVVTADELPEQLLSTEATAIPGGFTALTPSTEHPFKIAVDFALSKRDNLQLTLPTTLQEIHMNDRTLYHPTGAAVQFSLRLWADTTRVDVAFVLPGLNLGYPEGNNYTVTYAWFDLHSIALTAIVREQITSGIFTIEYQPANDDGPAQKTLNINSVPWLRISGFDLNNLATESERVLITVPSELVQDGPVQSLLLEVPDFTQDIPDSLERGDATFVVPKVESHRNQLLLHAPSNGSINTNAVPEGSFDRALRSFAVEASAHKDVLLRKSENVQPVRHDPTLAMRVSRTTKPDTMPLIAVAQTTGHEVPVYPILESDKELAVIDELYQSIGMLPSTAFPLVAVEFFRAAVTSHTSGTSIQTRDSEIKRYPLRDVPRFVSMPQKRRNHRTKKAAAAVIGQVKNATQPCVVR